MLRIFKILLVLSVAAWGLIGAMGNLLDWPGTYGAVEATVSMSAIEGGTEDFRSISNPLIIGAVAVAIPLTKAVIGVLCLIGCTRMWSARSAPVSEFHAAKESAIAGCALAVFLLFMGWIVLAESWFELWRSDVWRDAALQSAFRYAGVIGLIALIVGQRED